MATSGNGKPRKLLIIGAVAGGASCAARARRLDEHATIILFERGPDPSFANCGMPYFLGGEIKQRSALNVQTPASLKARLNLDVRVRSEVTAIDRAAKTITVKDIANGGKTYTEPYDALVLSMGSVPFCPPIPGIDRAGNLALRNLEDTDAIESWLRDPDRACQTAVVAGAGFIGMEMAEQLKRRGLDVTIVEALPQVMAPLDVEMAALLETECRNHGVAVRTNCPIQGFEAPAPGSSAKASDVILKGGERLPADIVILGLGVRADTALAKAAGLALGARGGIIVDEHMKTADPSIWAVGDAIEVKNPVLGDTWMVALAGPANRQGRLAADSICGGGSDGKSPRGYRGTFGTSAVRVFSLTAGATGANERMLRQKNLPFCALQLHPNSHAGYYPGAAQMALKILFNPETGKLWGAQCVGADGVDKRIDVLATALQAGMTVDDLAELELCYAPPFGSAKDPVNYAGMMGQNVIDGLVQTVNWEDLPALAASDGVLLLDVRGPAEIQKLGALHPRAINIPLDQLRARLTELPRDKKLVVSCMTGQRSYYACRILLQSGFPRVVNLTGAFKTWSAYGAEAAAVAAGKAVEGGA